MDAGNTLLTNNKTTVLNQMSIPPEIKELVHRFESNKASYFSVNYKEAQLRQEFINPFFKALGWDVYNEQGFAESYKDVIHEDSIRVGVATKAPDYCFQIGGARKFFVETKKPSVNIKDNAVAAFQLRRYAWSAKLSLSILTNFHEFAVYDCRYKPSQNDKASVSRIIYLTAEEFVNKWHEIYSIFSKNAIFKGEFDKYVASKKSKKGTTEVDKAFLQEIEEWRENLARNVAIRNPHLSQRDLNFAVQVTIDRIVFLRICEDRQIEEYGRLLRLMNGESVYQRMMQELFKPADEKYNSGLFYFKKEKGRPDNFDTLTPKIDIDDNILKDILKKLYYPESPYEFSVLSADILGQIYEQFLGKVIRLTTGHRAKVEEKPEVRKAGGVFYTPTYIVSYIIKNTVGKLIKGKKPSQVEHLRILDPACGSGSFLIAAYQYLLDWYRNWYAENNPEKWAKKSYPPIFLTDKNEWKLTTRERKQILINNIYGVDIDTQAVEVTKLSLLLKVLEGEDVEIINRQFAMKLGVRALPDLSENIKCGNSLVGSDFYPKMQLSMFDEEAQYRINAFDWREGFPGIMKTGGFDVVIGNPPYVRQELLSDLKDYFQKNYDVYHGIADLYIYFIERAISLCKERGYFSFIVSNKWLRANYGKPLRGWLKKKGLEEIVDFGDLRVFHEPTTYPCIIRIYNNSPHITLNACKVKTLDFEDLVEYVEEHKYHVNFERLLDSGWPLIGEEAQDLLEKVMTIGMPLSNYVDRNVFYGIKTGLNKAFVLDETSKNRLIDEDPKSSEIIKPFLAGRDVKRYEKPRPGMYLIFIPKGWTREKAQVSTIKGCWQWLTEQYPVIANHLKPHLKDARKRYDKGDYWWELRTCEYYEEFEKPKIIYPNICKRPEFTYDTEATYTNQKCFIIPIPDKYLLGILNSRLTFFLFRTILPKLRGDFYEPSYVYFRKFPIRIIDSSNPLDKTLHEELISLVDQMLDLHNRHFAAKTPHDKNLIQRQISATDKEIDCVVYQLYDLSDEEIRIVEEDLYNN